MGQELSQQLIDHEKLQRENTNNNEQTSHEDVMNNNKEKQKDDTPNNEELSYILPSKLPETNKTQYILLNDTINQCRIFLKENITHEKKSSLERIIRDSEIMMRKIEEDTKTISKQINLNKPYINLFPKTYYIPQTLGESDDDFKLRKDSFADYEELKNYLLNPDGYEGKLEKINKLIEINKEIIVNYFPETGKLETIHETSECSDGKDEDAKDEDEKDEDEKDEDAKDEDAKDEDEKDEDAKDEDDHSQTSKNIN